MKLVAMLLSFCISLNVLASSLPAQGLEQAFDNYHYSLTVEWDQSDVSFKEAQTNIFFTNLEALISQGLTNEEISNFVESKVSSQQMNSNIQTQLSLLASEASSSAELAKILSYSSTEFYQQGASWEYSRAQVATIIVAVSALFVFGVFFNIKYGCVQTIDGVKSYCTDDPSYNQF